MQSSSIAQLVAKQNKFFLSGKTKEISFRKEQLKKLYHAINDSQDQLATALKNDLGRPAQEVYTGDLAVVLDEVRQMLENLDHWASPREVSTPLVLQPGHSKIYVEPKGVVFVIGPWNFPFLLLFSPLAAAMAAGNCVILKSSEMAPSTSTYMKELVERTFDSSYVSLVEGGKETTQELLREKFDHIFFTGSAPVAKIVMAAAANHLTPVTLELGGKSPAIVTKHADLKVAARRICWGKFFNAGQTCVAPDFVMVEDSVKPQFLRLLEENIHKFFGAHPEKSDSYGRIVNQAHWSRLDKFLKTGKLVVGGKSDESQKYIAPTVIEIADWNAPLMQEEIFGPILPLMVFSSFQNTLEQIQTKDKPLAAYLFSESLEEQEEFLKFSFGGGCINDVVVHLGNPQLPFGGVGMSGMGSYHGEFGFLTFSHQKGVVHKSRWLDLSVRYPPYSSFKEKFLRWMTS